MVGPENTRTFKAYWRLHDLPFIGLPDLRASVLKRYGQEVNLFKSERMPASVIVDRTGIARFVHYSHDMSDIPENQELLGLLDQLNASNGDAKMSLIMILKVIACVLTAATGLLALVKPTAVYGFTGLNAGGARGISEIRAIFGGLFIALGIAPLVLGGVAYQMLGIGYLVIAFARLVSIFIDRSTASSNLISLAIETACGVILILR